MSAKHPRIRAFLRPRVLEILRPRQEILADCHGEIARARDAAAALSARLDALEGQIGQLRAELDRRPFDASMTVDAAWRRHPAARAVFARHHLPACDGCAVRFDETLGEAAMAYELDLDGLLAELNALLPP